MEETKIQESQIVEADKQQGNSVVGVPFVKDDPRINRAGRPKGKTIKERVREWLEDNPEGMKEFVEHFTKKDRELAWQMLEGRPQQDIVTDGKPLPSPIYGGLSTNELPKHISNEESLPA